ncbi:MULTISPECIES: right-handed parallel beta-helix repeat-containing protein [Amycolatopsis]|uniref:right-handed parallel beta-helix repeat-containing protein n=1 Tax=Amycolatopsis TaxID=1813 RepID=UPI0018E996AF|nr:MULTISPECIES: right-handed parallel beta-helix repeat-containing protein [Amycolatopsis]
MPARTTTRLRRVLPALALLAVPACTSGPTAAPTAQEGVPNQVAAVCGNAAPGPATPPAGAVVVDPGLVNDLAIKTADNPPGTTFWLAPGKHVLGEDQYDQVQPRTGNTYLGAPGAVFDGRGVNRYAFAGTASDVTIRHLVVTGFDAPLNEGVVNHDSGDGWIIEHNTIEDNRGAGLMAGARQQVRANCLRANGQYAMNAYQAGDTITGLVVEGNEITGNNTDNLEARYEGCGCTGGIKFWAVNGADVRGNWVHDNQGVGLWADTNNNDFLIEGNVIEGNGGAAIIYETSYNAIIRNNAIRRNNWVEGRSFVDKGDTFPAATIYISESGGEPRVPARTDKIEITGNDLTDNWSGITLWENADRFCNSAANTSTGYCTRLVPDAATCAQPAIAGEPLYSDCRWKTQRVDIHGNRFAFDPVVIGCRAMCGRMAVLSNYGTYPDWSPYKAEVIRQAITFGQDNRWHDNTYAGPWSFMAVDTEGVLDTVAWQAPPYQQDTGSTFTLRAGG